MKLNLGAGYLKVPGFKSVDFRKETKPDYLADLDKPKCLKRIKSNSVDEVMASHTMEHIKNIGALMEEIYRVCRHGAKVTITSPYWSHHTAVEDPTHVRYFTEKSMMYYSKDTIGSDRRPISIPYDFELKHITLYPGEGYEGKPVELLAKDASKYINVIRQITFELTVKKPMAKKKGGKKGGCK